MGFGELLGNDRMKDNLSSSLRRDRISHFYLIAGPEGSGKHTLARLLAAGLQCQEKDKPCLRCSACRKVLAGTHPDFITVDDPEKKTVPVDLIRQARADIFVRPNEGIRKIYLFPRAQDMGIPGQNALLKVLEEPPAYGVFLLLTDNPEKLLPTVRSRCTELKLLPLPQDLLRKQLAKEYPQVESDAIDAACMRSGGYLGQAKALLEDGETTAAHITGFVEAISEKNALKLTYLLVPMEKSKRDVLLPVLNQWLELVQGALSCRAGLPAVSQMARNLSLSRTPQELMKIAGHLKKAIEYTQSNVSTAAVCGFLEWALR